MYTIVNLEIVEYSVSGYRVDFHTGSNGSCLVSIVRDAFTAILLIADILFRFSLIENPMQNYFASDALLLILIKSFISSCRSLLIFESPAISRSTVKTALTVMLP